MANAAFLSVNQFPPLEDEVESEVEEPNNGTTPSPLMQQIMEIGFSRSAVELAFKTLGMNPVGFLAYLMCGFKILF